MSSGRMTAVLSALHPNTKFYGRKNSGRKMARIEAAFLKSKVARRIFFLFASCIILPIAVLAVMSFYQVSQESVEQKYQELKQTSKSRGMDILERLAMLGTELHIIAIQVQQGESIIPAAGLQEHFSGISIYKEQKLAAVLMGTALPLPVLTTQDAKHLQSNKPLIISTPCAEAETCLEMIRAIDPLRLQAGLIIGKIKTSYLWDIEASPPGFQISVFDTNAGKVKLLCGDRSSVPPEIEAGNRTALSASRDFQWKKRKRVYDAAYWVIFLVPGYGMNPWILVASKPHDDLLNVVQKFRRSFPLIVLLTLWIATLASLVQIRRTMVPLEKLQAGTMQIGAQNFESRVEVQSDDEFQELATSFNAMAEQLGKQFQALKTISEIDQAILGSMNREGILRAVLDRVSDLHTCHCVGIGLVHDGRVPTGASLSIVRTQSVRGIELLATEFSPADLQQMQENPQSFEVETKASLPKFLAPILGDLSCFSIFPIFVDNKPFGVLVYGHASEDRFTETDRQHARQIADQLAVAFSNVRLIEALEQLHWGTLKALARAIDAKSNWTGGHSERVTRLALKIASTMGLGWEELRVIERGGLLHDIGKIGTPRSILDKPGKLDEEEVRIMREHVNIGMRILEPIPGLGDALPIVSQHHERFDGTGYPNGLKGEQINLFARIFAVADSYDAMTSDRPYRSGMPAEKARAIVSQEAGKQFDPDVVAAFLEMYNHPEALDNEASEPMLLEQVVQS